MVHDRYVNYDHFAGINHQLCTAHLLRDIEDAAQACPDAAWPGQVAEHLRGLIHEASVARSEGLAVVPEEGSPSTSGCSAAASTSACPRSAASPAARKSSSRPACSCWSA